jgi:hypothetical protein
VTRPVGRLRTIKLTDREVDKLLSILGMAEIEYADLIATVCAQAERPLPDATRRFLSDRAQGRL